MSQPNTDSKYQILSELDHILTRAGMYIGSTTDIITPCALYQPSKNRFVIVDQAVTNAALQKLFDEILSNSVDEHRRVDSLFRIDTISVNVKTDGTITVRDNGGISIAEHKQASKLYGRSILIPELIFGILRTSSNYDDSKERNVVGTNGLGAKLTNIFSKSFRVTTADGKQKVTIQWENNMRSCNVGKLEKVDKAEHFTEIEFQLDLERLGFESLDLAHIRQMQKRCIDACATNPKLVMQFSSDIAEGKLNGMYQFKKFEDYSKLYYQHVESDKILSFVGNANQPMKEFRLVIIPESLNCGNVGFVNGALCSSGTHMKIIQKQIVDHILEYCKKNGMELFTERDVLNTITMFVSCDVRNPVYDSQTKTNLTSKLTRFDLRLSDAFLKQILQSDIIKQLELYWETKYAAEKRKETRKLNAALKQTKVSKKLIACTSRAVNKELLIFEGNSASAGFRKFRNPQTQSAYLLRGKIRNAFNLERAKILENQELREIIALLNLQFDDAKKNLKQLEYSKIIVYSDADPDGGHICGLLLAFLTKHFRELIEAGRVYRAITPIVVAYNAKTKEKRYFYTQQEFDTAYKTDKFLSKFEVRYTKGLGGLDDNDYQVILSQQKLVRFRIQDATDVESVQVWFDKDSTERKKILLDSNNEGE